MGTGRGEEGAGGAAEDGEAVSVAELIEALMALPQDAIVIGSIDQEGNGFNELSSVELGYSELEYRERRTFKPDYVLTDPQYGPEDHEEHAAAKEHGVRAVALWP